MERFRIVKKAILGEKMPEKPLMKVTMMGPRGVGKTSVLISMCNSMHAALNDTRLYPKADLETELMLNKKINDLKRMFSAGNSIHDKVQSGIAGDETVSKFTFEFGLNTENVNIELELQDFPGAYVSYQPEIVKQYIEESNAVIIAIDTPHLMECGGRYNEDKNYTSVITNFFKQTLNKDSGEKLIILVPLKCEKYYHEGNIDQVTETVRSTYRELISFLRDKENDNGIQGRFACVIAPILTVGEIVFDEFESEDGKIREFVMKDRTLPANVKYRYLTADAKYTPKHCEQLLYYLLSFVGKQYLRMGEKSQNGGLWGKVMKKYAPLLRELHIFTTKKLDQAEGFMVCMEGGSMLS